MPTISIPIRGKGDDVHPEPIHGTVAILDVGGRKIRFLIHKSRNNPGRHDLTHIASGYRVGSISAARSHARNTQGISLTQREGAKYLINHIINHYGIDEVLRRFDSAPKINE